MNKTWNPISSKGFNNKSWTYNNYNDYFSKFEKPNPSQEEMIDKILSGIDEKDFFKDMLDWLKEFAPRKVGYLLDRLYVPINSGLTCSYEGLCELVYKFQFRASEIIERRMILGPNNKWVQEYFKDFPNL